MKKGIFITFEGIEGSGKSTQISRLSGFLEDSGIEYTRTVEPGGTLIGDEIRKILLSVEHNGMTSLTELLLYAASRAQHVGEVIKPALDRGRVVVCDRFTDSTMAYQGYGRGIDRELISLLNAICTGKTFPDLTILLDLDVETGLSRNRSAEKIDRLELEAADFHRRVREGYHAIEKAEPGRVRTVDASGGIEAVSEKIRQVFLDFLRENNYVAQ
ncbi:MAG: dTMP kinase [bacterium]